MSEFEWEGPGLERRALRASGPLHAPALADQLAAKMQPLQKRSRPPAIEYAGRPLWSTREEALKLSLERQYITVEAGQKGDVPEF